MKKYIEIINEPPDARKKGFRMVIRGITIDDGKLTEIDCDYSTYHQCGGFRLYVDKPIGHIILMEGGDAKC